MINSVGMNIINSNYSSGTTVYNYSLLSDGLNTVSASCSDLFGSSSTSLSFVLYAKTIFLWDEVNNIPFNISNVSDARLWVSDNSTYFSFKSSTKNNISVASINTSKVRIELDYTNGDVITRYIDLSLFSGKDIKVCANLDNGIRHYQQIVISSTNKPVTLQNSFVPCFIAADYTRFAYDTYNVLQAFTINNLYYIRTLDSGGNVVLLGSFDGSLQASNINIDQLEFQQQQVSVRSLGDVLTFQNLKDTERVLIYYKNSQMDNSDLSATITRVSNNQVLFSASNFTNNNEFTLYFDYSTLTNLSNGSLFKVSIVAFKTDGTTKTLSKYFNTEGGSGYFPPGVAFVLSILLIVFGLTFATARITFGWFGIFIEIAAIAILSLSSSSWYVLFLTGIEVIVLAYTCIVTFRDGGVGLS